RAANYRHPEWNWLLPVARLGINAIGLALLYPIHLGYPYFAAASGLSPGADALARGLSTIAWWVAVSGFSVFLASQIGLNGWMCFQHARFLQRQREEQAS